MIHLFISSYFFFSYQSLSYSSVSYGFDFDFICHVQLLVAHELKIFTGENISIIFFA